MISRKFDMNTTGRKSKIANITGKVFLASMRTARFNISDEIKVNDDGISIELKGHMEPGLITDSIEKSQNNIRQLAYDFLEDIAATAMKDQGFRSRFDVDELDPKDVQIVEEDGTMYLKLPAEVYNKKKMEEKKKQKEEEEKSNFKGMDKGEIRNCFEKLLNEFTNFINKNESKIRTVRNKQANWILFFDERIVKKDNVKTDNPSDNYVASFKISETAEDNDTSILVRVYLMFKKDEKTIYNNYIEKSFKLKDYDLEVINKDNEGVYFSNDKRMKANELVKEINNFKTEAGKTFHANVLKRVCES